MMLQQTDVMNRRNLFDLHGYKFSNLNVCNILVFLYSSLAHQIFLFDLLNLCLSSKLLKYFLIYNNSQKKVQNEIQTEICSSLVLH